jgi:hypothetical protein
MGLLAIKIVAIWSIVAVLVGLAAGAVIRVGERLHKDEVLSALFAAVSAYQTTARQPARY